MKKWAIIITILVVACFLFFKWFFNQPCEPPEKPDKVPQSAVWKGGCDGGHWMELVEIKDNKYRFRIYRDWDGELALDADFIFSGSECKNNKLSMKNWSTQISYYSSSLDSLQHIVLKDTETPKCYLETTYPAYGGEEWEIIKEKYKIE
jgi:hypothetical protein